MRNQRLSFGDEERVVVAAKLHVAEVSPQYRRPVLQAEPRIDRRGRRPGVQAGFPGEHPDLSQVPSAVRRGEEPPCRPENAMDLCDGRVDMRDEEEHVVGDDTVEALVAKGNGLCVGHQVRERPLEGGQVSRGVDQHSFREVGERDVPRVRDALLVHDPQASGAAAQLQNPGFLRQVEMVEYPPPPAVFVGAEPAVEVDPRA